ncbi:MAG: hypothetical protein KF736_07860 [Acidobacteria bacterium]|nr:hypothetical protein [Acidobacteriota bacterium]MCW5948964.1 hypothetical protein [Pyrinomonadaceae bacterium]
MLLRLIAATVAGGVANFAFGFLIYGLLLDPMMRPNFYVYAGEAGPLMKEPPSLIPLVLACLTISFLITLIFEKWAGIRSLAAGAMGGAVIFALVSLYFGFSMFAFMRIYRNFSPLLVDIVASGVMGALVGGVIGLVLGALTKKES